MIIPKDPITRDEYFARVDAGVPYEGPVEGMGYAMKEMVVTPRSTNKSKNRIFWNISYLNVSITLERDAIQTKDRTNEIHVKQQDIARSTENQQRQAQIIQELKVKLDAYYKYVIGETKKLPGFNFKVQAAFEEQKKKVTLLIEDKNTPLIYSQLPRTFYIQNLALLHELGSYRNHNRIAIPNKNEQLKGNWPEQYQTERIHMDPFATKMAQQPAIKAVAVTGIVLMGAEGAVWLGNSVWQSGAINTNLTSMTREGLLSLFSQLILEEGDIREINATSLLTDIF